MKKKPSVKELPSSTQVSEPEVVADKIKDETVFELEITWIDPRDLVPYENNAKEHPPDQVKSIARQIYRFGFDQPIVVDEGMVILKGHGRRLASMQLGLKKVPCVVKAGLSEAEKIAIRLADNRSAERGRWDKAKLRFDLNSLQGADFNLDDADFSLAEAQAIFDDDRPPPSKKKKDDEPQFIVAVTCRDEEDMKLIYEELTGRGLNCRLIT